MATPQLPVMLQTALREPTSPAAPPRVLEPAPLVSVVLPCLNEEEGIGPCIETIQRTFATAKISGEIVVCDNGSTDRSVAIAERLGARVVHQPLRGYGNAYLTGFAAARGTYLIMGDADDTYDFTLIPQFLTLLIHKGYDFVTGSRYLGGGDKHITALHRFVGNPALTALLNGLFGTSYTDVYCGFRGFSRQAYTCIQPVSPGMEFNLELAINAGLAKFKTIEVPITLRPRQGKSKLRTLRDGWRSVRMMVLYCPNKLFLWPGALLCTVGLLTHAAMLLGVLQWGGRPATAVTGLFALMLSVLGVEILSLGLHAKTYSWSRRFDKHNAALEWFYSHFKLEHGLALGAGLLTLGGCILGLSILQWVRAGMLPLPHPAWTSFAATLMITGCHVCFSSLFISMMSIAPSAVGAGGNVCHMPRSSLPSRVLTTLGLIAGSLLIAATLHRGPGLGAYLPWASALVQGTPAPLDTITLAPTGFPLFQWYPGTGVFLALPTLVSGGAVPLEHSARLVASIAIVLTLAACASCLYTIARQRVGLLLLGLALLLAATNTGYYIRLLGAELFALAVVASLVWLAWIPPKIGHVELVGLSALAGLLMTVRPQSCLMAAPAMVLGLLRWVSGRPRPQLAWACLSGGGPVALGLLVVLQVNHWMTGEWTRSPYYFGNDHFQSVTLSAPYLWLVLFDPAAGLLRRTPFIALGLCAALVPILDRRLAKAYRAFYLVALLAGLAQIWVISGSYSWAGGAWIFGSRYLNLLSLYSVMAVVHVLACERSAWALQAVVLSAAVVCAAYTAHALGLPDPLLGVLAVGAAAAAGLAVATPRPRHSLSDLTYGCVGLALLGLLLSYYAGLARPQLATVLTTPAVLVGGGAAVGIGIAVAVRGSACPSASAAAKSLALGAVMTLVIGGSLVARLRMGAAAFQARELASPSPHFLYKNRFDVRNLEEDLKQDTVYKWPEEVKQAIRSFLEEEKQRTAIPRPSYRVPAI